MIKEKQSFFEKISGGKKASLKTENADEPAENKPFLEIGNEAQEVQEGQLAVDVYETEIAVVVESIIGGVDPENINIAVSNNVLTIKGVRGKNADTNEPVNYFVSECFWGSFSRSIILPCEVDVDGIKASIKKGVLKITLPKLMGSKTKKIKIEEE